MQELPSPVLNMRLTSPKKVVFTTAFIIKLEPYLTLYMYISTCSRSDSTEYPDSLSLYHSLLIIGFLDCIQCLHKADVSLPQHFNVHV